MTVTPQRQHGTAIFIRNNPHSTSMESSGGCQWKGLEVVGIEPTLWVRFIDRSTRLSGGLISPFETPTGRLLSGQPYLIRRSAEDGTVCAYPDL